MKTSPTISLIGYKAWQNESGRYHRLDGPARMWEDGSEEWYINGQLHRLDGPAVIDNRVNPLSNRLEPPIQWWINGQRISCSSQEEFEKLLTLKEFW